jgi:hypothetical protein
MVLELSRFWSFLWPAPRTGGGTAKPRPIDFSRLSAHDLADLNLPPDIRARIGLQQSREKGMGRW